MSITSRKITSITVLKGVTPSSKALPVISNDINPIIDDLTSIDARVIILEKDVVIPSAASAINATAVATAAQVATGYITSTSAALTSITLPTATELSTALGAGAGSQFDFVVDNTAGAQTVTIVVGSGITAATPVVTGGATLTVSVANAIGVFRIVWSSATVAKLFRLG